MRLKASKTDPFRLGGSVILGRTDSELCLVAEVLAYMGVRGIAPGPFCQFADGMLFTRVRFVEAIRSARFSVGITATSYSGNSFSYGGNHVCGLPEFRGVSDVLVQLWDAGRAQLVCCMFGLLVYNCVL